MLNSNDRLIELDTPVARASAAVAAGDALALFAAVDDFAAEGLGHALCTVNRFDAARMGVTRLYSSNPRAYPAGGTKDKLGTDWGRHVLIEKRVYVGEGTTAIRAAFDDHAAITALGLQSVINVPVQVAGAVVGTFNVLMTQATLGPEHVTHARLAALMAVPGFMLLNRQA
ncbi:GAF domain-containing protein [Alcaligenaceae bacterium A4P071]|nr:GAF domain-containing protein [Alcaligenaceae bacterium A4P071]